MELSYGATFEPKAKFGAVRNGHVMRRRCYKRDLDLDWEIGREECWVETLVYGSFFISVVEYSTNWTVPDVSEARS